VIEAKILLTSDWHLDARTAGVPRIDELDSYVDEIIRVAIQEKIDFIFHLGDFFNPGTKLVPFYTSKLIRFIQHLDYSTASDGVVLIAGNHDVIEDSRGYTVLSPLKIVFEACYAPRVVEHTSFFVLTKCNHTSIGVLALPYTARSVDDSQYLKESLIRAKEFVNKKGTGPLIVVGHRTVPGATLGSETKDMSRGRDIDLPFDVFKELNPVLIANGHYHRAQIVSVGSHRVVIPGSPYRLTFGERRDKFKGFMVVRIPLQGAKK
jgi:DNA repair exonuclease SbcCD nuclease subunit